MVRILFIIYIVFVTAFDGFLDQEAHNASNENKVTVSYERSSGDNMMASTGQVSSQPARDQKSDDCPDPENCHSCHQCMGHCGFIFSSSIEIESFQRELQFGSFVKALVSRDYNSLFRPPIAS